jgi:ribosomal protein S18 acetylase RimI-like enzyme
MIVEEIGSDHAGIGARAARHFEIAFRRIMRGADAVQNAAYLRLVTGVAHPMGNIAIVSEPGNLGAALEATAPLLLCGAPATAVFPRGVGAVVAGAVKQLGFKVEASMPAMAVEIDRMAATALPPGYDLARIGAGDEGRAWAEALAIGYEIPRPLANRFAPEALGADMALDAQVQFFAALHEGRQVATSMLFLADGLAGIYCVSTRPEERNQGLGAHVTAEALRAARRLGYRVGVLQSSNAGYRVYEGLGFGSYAQLPMLIHVH